MFNTIKFILNHPLNRGRPLPTPLHCASAQIPSRLNEEVKFDWINGIKLVVRNGVTGTTGNIYCGLHEYASMRTALTSK